MIRSHSTDGPVPPRLLRRAGSLLALLLGVALAAPDGRADVSDQSRSYYESALERIEEGDGRAAIVQLRNALQADPANHEARVLLGKLRLAAGEPEAAEKDLRLALEGRYSDEAEVLLGRALVDQLKFEDVIRIVSRDALTEERLQDKLIVLADAYWGLRNLAEVEALYDQVLATWPDNQEARLGVARLHLAHNQRGRAEEITDELLARFPGYVDGWVLRADLAILDQNETRALEALEQALTLQPNNVNAMIERARLHLETGDWEAARTDIDSAAALKPNNPYVLFISACYDFANGRLIEADSYYVNVERMLPDEPPVLILGALIKHGLGDYAQAQRFLSRYLTKRPNSLAAQRSYALVLLKQQNAVTALNVLEPLVAEHPDDSAALHLLSTAYLMLRRHGSASRMLQQILESGHTDAEGLARQGLSQLARDAGIGGWQPDPEADVLPPGLAEDMFPVVDLLQSDQLEEARARVRELKRSYPDNPFLLTLEGIVLFERENRDAARASFERALTIEPEFLAALDNLERLDQIESQEQRIEPRMHELLLRRPRSESLILKLAEQVARRRGAQAAIELLEERRLGFPESVAIARTLIDAYLSLGSGARPLQILEELMITHADSFSVLGYVQGRLADLKAYDRAVEVMRRLIVLDPQSVAYRLRLAKILSDAGRSGDSQAVLLEAKDMDPGNPQIALGLIGIALNAGDLDQATELAADLEPYDEILSERFRGHILLQTGETEKAIETLEAAYARDPRSDLAIDLFFARRKAGDLPAAIAVLEAHVAARANDRQVRHALASSLAEAGRHAEAMEHYQALVDQSPDDVLALNNLAWLRDTLGHADGLDYAKRAYALAPDAPQVADTYGWLLVRADDLAAGIPVLRRAIGQAPRDLNVRYRLAFALQESGNASEAREILQSILQPGTEFAERSNAEQLLGRLDN